MFFKKAKAARMYAAMETVRTHLRHIVTPCIKYLPYEKLYFGKDYINGFTVILER